MQLIQRRLHGQPEIFLLVLQLSVSTFLKQEENKRYNVVRQKASIVNWSVLQASVISGHPPGRTTAGDSQRQMS